MQSRYAAYRKRKEEYIKQLEQRIRELEFDLQVARDEAHYAKERLNERIRRTK